MLEIFADHAVNGYFLMATWAALYLALCYAAEVKSWERRAADLRAATQSAELRALRYQVNPHLLFNTLNALSSLVMTRRSEEAERMILNLSRFFRSSLAHDPTEDVPLREEVQLQRLYLDIEAVRFPDRLRVEIDVPEELQEARVPALILQPLVENAVKHGVAASRRCVTLRIRARRSGGLLELTVEDDAPAAKITEDGAGVGLRNVADRLAARHGAKAQSRVGPTPEGGFAAVLSLPLVLRGG